MTEDMKTSFVGVALIATNDKEEVCMEYNYSDLKDIEIKFKDNDLENEIKDKLSLVFRYIPEFTFSVHVKVKDIEGCCFKVEISYKGHDYIGCVFPSIVYPGIVILKDWVDDNKYDNGPNLKIFIEKIPETDYIRYLKILTNYEQKWLYQDRDDPINVFKLFIREKNAEDCLNQVYIKPSLKPEDIQKASEYYKNLKFYDIEIKNLFYDLMDSESNQISVPVQEKSSTKKKKKKSESVQKSGEVQGESTPKKKKTKSVQKSGEDQEKSTPKKKKIKSDQKSEEVQGESTPKKKKKKKSEV